MQNMKFKLKITNSNNRKSSAVIFGESKFKNAPNYGSDEGVELSGSGLVKYEEMIDAINGRLFLISAMEVRCDNNNHLPKTIQVIVDKPDVFQDIIDVEVDVALSDMLGGADVLTIPFHAIIDKNTHLKIITEPSSEMYITLHASNADLMLAELKLKK